MKSMCRYVQCIWLLLFVNTIFCQIPENVPDICVTTGGYIESDHCYVANSSGGEYHVCVVYTDAAGCIERIKNQKSEIAVFSTEAALVANAFIGKDVFITRPFHLSAPGSTNFQLSVISRKNLNLVDLLHNRVKLCLPGFQRGYPRRSHRIMNMVERFIQDAAKETPPSELTSINHELKTLSTYLSDSCKTRPWAYDPSYNRELSTMSQFSELCNLCDFRENCTYDYVSTFNTLRCLTERGGDFAVSDVTSIREYFGFAPNFAAQANPTDYKYLCLMGNGQELSSTASPCPWLTQPTGIAVVSRTSKYVEYLDSVEHSSPLYKALTTNYTFILENRNATANTTLDEFLRAARPELHEKWAQERFTRTMRLCVVDPNEVEKCKILAVAVHAQDIRPRLECETGSSKEACIGKVKRGDADFVGVSKNSSFAGDSSLLKVARQYKSVIVTIVRRVQPLLNSTGGYTSTIPYRACFPEYNGSAWNSFIYASSKLNRLPKVCPYAKAISNFFTSACAPGADKDILFNMLRLDKLCALCSGNCDNNDDNPYYGDVGAFRCLHETNADFAVVNYPNMLSMLQDKALMHSLPIDDYVILCNDGRMLDLREYNSLTENCIHSVGTTGLFLGSKTSSKAVIKDIEELLSGMQYIFEEKPLMYDTVFRLYKHYNGKDNLIFENSTISVIPERPHSNKLVDYDSTVIDYVKVCTADPITPATTKKPFTTTRNTLSTTTEKSDGASVNRENIVFLVTFSVVLFLIDIN